MSATVDYKRRQIAGRGIPVTGNDIDTDRIIPARFLRCVTFDGIGEHAFEDDRKQAKGDHPLDDPRFRGATVLIVGRNFGCGSSREHAPQSLMRFGFRAFVGASFAEIFAGNCTALGLPCVTLEDADLESLMDSVALDPAQLLVLDLEARTLKSRAGIARAGIRDGVRTALLEGSWNATAVLVDAGEAIERTARALPYVSGFQG